MQNVMYIDLKVKNLKIIIGIAFVRVLIIRNVLMLVSLKIYKNKMKKAVG